MSLFMELFPLNIWAVSFKFADDTGEVHVRFSLLPLVGARIALGTAAPNMITALMSLHGCQELSFEGRSLADSSPTCN